MSTHINGMLPSAPDIERAVLASLLNHHDTEPIFRTIRPEWFHVPAHKTIFQTIKRAPTADMLVIEQKIRDAGEDIGGDGELQAIAGYFDFIGQVDNYATELKKKYVAREAVLSAMKVSNAAMSGDEDPVDIATRELSHIVEISRQGTARNRTMREIMATMIDDLERRMEDDTSAGFVSRYPSLNEDIGGIPRNYIVIGGETSAGKSSLAQSLLEDVVFLNDKRAAWYSMEMNERDLAYRLSASRGGIDGKRIFNPRNHHMTQQDISSLTKAVKELGDSDIILRPEPFITVDDIRNECRDYAADGNMGLIVVDYMQLIETATDRNTTQEQAMSKVSKTLLAISKELDVAVIGLTQLNDNGKIRSCRSIGHDAEVYLTIEPDGLLIAKNRNGERDKTMPVILDKPHFRFIEYVPRD